MAIEFEPSERRLIVDAAAYLEHPTLLVALANLAGKPLEIAAKWIDRLTPDSIDSVVEAALKRAMGLALYTIPEESSASVSVVPDDINDIGSRTSFWHNLSVAATGATGGFFGLAGLPVELPMTTVVMLRSIASIAKEFGEDLSQPDVPLQCLTVFSLGAPAKAEDAMETSYLTARLGLQKLVMDAAHLTARASSEELLHMIQKGTAPALVKLIAKVAARFNVAVTQKLMAQAVPIVGAVSGAAINVAFMDHFNRVARFHFGIRRLERKYGAEAVQVAYQDAARAAIGPAPSK